MRLTIIFSLFLAFLTGGVFAEESAWVGGYNSRDGGLEEGTHSGSRETLYTMFQLGRLRRAVSPRYIRLLDLEKFRNGENSVVKGILFTCEGYRARNVAISGDFNNWTPSPMRRNSMGVYYYMLPVREIENGERIFQYKYKFLVDGIWKHDATNQNHSDDGLGGSISEFHLNQEDVNRLISVRVLRDSKPSAEKLVEFAIFLPQVENLSLVGTFNNWNPEHDLLIRGNDGIFRLRLRLRPGEYVYKFIADGRWVLDPFNPESRFHRGLEELCSYLNLQ